MIFSIYIQMETAAIIIDDAPLSPAVQQVMGGDSLFRQQLPFEWW